MEQCASFCKFAFYQQGETETMTCMKTARNKKNKRETIHIRVQNFKVTVVLDLTENVMSYFLSD